MVSILIPIYNGIEYLNESLSSVIKQTYTDWEVIIGINGHLPNSDVETTAHKIKYNICPTNISDKIKIKYYSTKGKAATLNAMVCDCKYDKIALIDVDDIWESDKLEKQSRFWNEYDVVGTNCNYFGDMTGSPNIPTGDISHYDFLSGNPIINSSAVIKKDYAKWNEENNVGLEDYELWLQLRLQNKTFYNISNTLCLHRIDQNSSFNNSNYRYVHQLVNKYRLKYNSI